MGRGKLEEYVANIKDGGMKGLDFGFAHWAEVCPYLIP